MATVYTKKEVEIRLLELLASITEGKKANDLVYIDWEWGDFASIESDHPELVAKARKKRKSKKAIMEAYCEGRDSAYSITNFGECSYLQEKEHLHDLANE